MKAIIVAAGEGTRMRPLTNDKPKQLVELQGKPLLDHILNSLPEEISALIIVVGYKGDQIRTWYGVTHAGKPITYVEQTERKGTWHALSLCEPYIEKGEKFFYLYADDLHGREGLRECIAASDKGCTMSVTEVEDPRRFCVVEIDETVKITHAEEKPDLPRSHLVSTGAFVLTPEVFKYRPALHKWEEYLFQSVAAMIQDGHAFYAVPSTFWFPIGYPEDVARAEAEVRPEHLL